MASNDSVPSWHGPISNGAAPLFWAGLGVVLGAFGAVVFGAFNPNSEWLRLYITAMSAGLGVLGGFVATMIADRRKDRVSFRRKTMATTHRLDRLRLQFETIAQLAEPLEGKPVPNLPLALEVWNQTPVMLIGLLLQSLAELGRHPPTFEDVLETSEDRGAAMHAEELFAAATNYEPRGEGGRFPSFEDSAAAILSLVQSGGFVTFREYADTLAQIIANFERKLG